MVGEDELGGGVGEGVSICTMLHCHTVTMLQHTSGLRNFAIFFFPEVSTDLQIFLSPLEDRGLCK